jgi:hypothetical protein
VLDFWRELLPAAEVIQLSDAGHFVLEDAATEPASRWSSSLAEPSQIRPEHASTAGGSRNPLLQLRLERGWT